MKKSWLIVLVLLVLFGCTTTQEGKIIVTEEDVKKIQATVLIGMTTLEVLEILGDPDTSINFSSRNAGDPDTDVWQYPDKIVYLEGGVVDLIIQKTKGGLYDGR